MYKLIAALILLFAFSVYPSTSPATPVNNEHEVKTTHAQPPASPMMSRVSSVPTSEDREVTSCCLCMVPDKSMPKLQQLNAVSFIPIKAVERSQDITREAALKFLRQNYVEGTMVINGTLYHVERGISDKLKTAQKPVTIYSGGYSHHCRPYSYGGHTAIRSGLVPGSCVTFEFATDTQRAFNFCQEQDLHCLQTMCGAVLEKHPHASLILHGACKGATNNLRFLAESSGKGSSIDNIKAVIAESPPISVSKALERTPLSCITLCVVPWVLPNYNPQQKTIMQAHSFPQIPVLIASLPDDTISKLEDIQQLKEHLIRACKGNVQHFVSRFAHLQHGKIREADDYQKAVGAFLVKAGLSGHAKTL